MFEMEWRGRRVALKASNGRYVCMKKNGQLAAISDFVGEQSLPSVSWGGFPPLASASEPPPPHFIHQGRSQIPGSFPLLSLGNPGYFLSPCTLGTSRLCPLGSLPQQHTRQWPTWTPKSTACIGQVGAGAVHSVLSLR